MSLHYSHTDTYNTLSIQHFSLVDPSLSLVLYQYPVLLSGWSLIVTGALSISSTSVWLIPHCHWCSINIQYFCLVDPSLPLVLYQYPVLLSGWSLIVTGALSISSTSVWLVPHCHWCSINIQYFCLAGPSLSLVLYQYPVLLSGWSLIVTGALSISSTSVWLVPHCHWCSINIQYILLSGWSPIVTGALSISSTSVWLVPHCHWCSINIQYFCLAGPSLSLVLYQYPVLLSGWSLIVTGALSISSTSVWLVPHCHWYSINIQYFCLAGPSLLSHHTHPMHPLSGVT